MKVVSRPKVKLKIMGWQSESIGSTIVYKVCNVEPETTWRRRPELKAIDLFYLLCVAVAVSRFFVILWTGAD
jgi:hypothetical protein